MQQVQDNALNTANNRPFLNDFIREVLRSGAIAALVMAPLGFAAFVLGFRVNEYGIKVVRTLFGEELRPIFVFLLFLIEHFLISWVSAIPLLLGLLKLRMIPGWLLGAVYGGGFYIVVNSLLLPTLFGDPTPWELGIEVIMPSLIVHVAYGLSIWWTSRAFIGRHPAA